MTPTITIPKETFDAMREALKRMLDLWDRTRESGALPLDYVRCKAALNAANAVSEADTTAELYRYFARRSMEANTAQPQAQPCKTLCELCVKRGYLECANTAKTTPIIVQPQAPEAP